MGLTRRGKWENQLCKDEVFCETRRVTTSFDRKSEARFH
jgi:hypothetical protein